MGSGQCSRCLRPLTGNPPPRAILVLMLTAIVVAVATLGVALSLAIKIYQIYGTLDEDEVLMRLKKEGRQ